LLDRCELAGEIRLLDMQASPYDLSSLGERAVAIETREGKAEYVTRQREFAGRAAALRRRLIEVCDALLRTSRETATQRTRKRPITAGDATISTRSLPSRT